MSKILIVDDDTDVVDLVKTRLEKNNYKVVTASDGQEGVAKAQTEKPNLILMDIMMPNMQGGDAVRVLKSNADTKDIPIIFLTAVTTNTNPVGEEDAGVNVAGTYYPAIGKPFDAEDLLAIIEKHLFQ